MDKIKQETYADRQLISDADMLLRISKDLDGEEWVTGAFAIEVCLDCAICDVDTFARDSVKQYIEQVSGLIGISSEVVHFTDYSSTSKLIRNPGVEVATTGNVTVRTLPSISRVYINIISSKPFREGAVQQFTDEWFKAKWCKGFRLVRN